MWVSILEEQTAPASPEPLTPEIKTLETTEVYGKFVLEPLERGYGMTIGNPLRRVLLASVPGTAVTWVKIAEVLHEYSSIPHVKEEVMDFLLNVKAIRIHSLTDRPGKMRLEVAGEGKVCAGDIVASSDFQIVNPELHLATLESPEASLSVEFNVEPGKGYQPATQSNGLPVGTLPVDAIFTPVRKVDYSVERTRVGQVTDYERLVLEVWTDGTISPVEAIQRASETLVNHFFLLTVLGKVGEAAGEGPAISKAIPAEAYQTPIERLELSPRTLNCLKRAHISKVGEVLEMTKVELLKIRNFGEKSLEELYLKLKAHDLLPEELEPYFAPGESKEPAAPPSEEEKG
ncbi:MAG: DNA-directed RNA polymerase subunit alpha [Dehalococcoidia bacterium]